MTTSEIRAKYLAFFEAKGHKVIPRANLVPQDDPTTLFTGSGMQPLLPYLLGAPHPEGQRLVNSQTCFRAEDIEEVGDNRHTTFFEMLGNWSLGDYFKREQLEWFFTFLTEEVGLDPNKLYVTVFSGDKKLGVPRDEESTEVWQRLFKDKGMDNKVVEFGNSQAAAEQGMQNGRIFYYNASKNWWSRTGEPENMPEGEPGGPDSEVFYDFGTKHDSAFGKECHPNCGCGRFLEIGNSVFMQYVKTAKGFDELPQRNVDFGGGLERIAAAKNDDPDVFKIDLLWPIINELEKLSGKTYQNNQEAMRVITDHLRAAVWLATDGVVPSNKTQGYVMRRLTRRAIRYALELGIEHDLMKGLIPAVVVTYKADYPEVAKQSENTGLVLQKEEQVFRQTLRKGLREFDKILMLDKVGEGERIRYNQALTGEIIFTLYDTYGFPFELSLEEADKRGIEVAKDWQKEFDRLMQEQRERSRTATKGQFKGGLGGHGDIHKRYHTTTHILYATLRKVLGEHVIQRGANITEERVRFDFEHPEKVTPEQQAEIEKQVNEVIDKCLPVKWEEYSTEEAFEQGAVGQFGDRYGDKVKVYSVGEGNKRYSFEICGGPHVENTCEIKEGSKRFKITKEESSSAGVRRIKAALE